LTSLAWGYSQKWRLSYWAEF